MLISRWIFVSDLFSRDFFSLAPRCIIKKPRVHPSLSLSLDSTPVDALPSLARCAARAVSDYSPFFTLPVTSTLYEQLGTGQCGGRMVREAAEA